MLPFSEACERNKGPILAIIEAVFRDTRHVVEIGSGTGQHAVHFARHLPHLDWQPTDRPEFLAGLAARITLEGTANLQAPVVLDVMQDPWPPLPADAVFSANTLHIMSWDAVQALFAGVGGLVRRPGSLVVYGPFRYGGRYTSGSNAAFDEDLRARDPASGIRDFESVDALATAQGFRLEDDHRMPANNQLLVWRRD